MKSRPIVDGLESIMWLFLEFCAAPVCFLMAVIARRLDKPIDVGLGPEPLINNIYHKSALEKHGYSAETFVTSSNFISKKYDHTFPPPNNEIRKVLHMVSVFWFCIRRYKILYIYFNGGALMSSYFLWRLEPLLYSIANCRVVVMPYGGDVIDFTRSSNLLFKHAMTTDYPDFYQRKPRVQAQIDLWIANGDHIISGCDWVDYLYHWDSLMLAHFSIDVDRLAALSVIQKELPPIDQEHPLWILHAPNHQAVKGTGALRRAVEELAADGVPVRLELIEFAPNEQVLEGIARSDVVVDQLIIGWYALFALEAMSMAKPVVCFLRPDLVRLYTDSGLVGEGEIPLIQADVKSIKSVLRDLAAGDRRRLAERGRQAQAYVQRHHSLQAVGRVFAGINRSLGVFPVAPVE